MKQRYTQTHSGLDRLHNRLYNTAPARWTKGRLGVRRHKGQARLQPMSAWSRSRPGPTTVTLQMPPTASGGGRQASNDGCGALHIVFFPQPLPERCTHTHKCTHSMASSTIATAGGKPTFPLASTHAQSRMTLFTEAQASQRKASQEHVLCICWGCGMPAVNEFADRVRGLPLRLNV